MNQAPANHPPPQTSEALGILVVLPAYNEAENLQPLLTALSETLPGVSPNAGVLVVDDGSSDATPDVLGAFRSVLSLSVIRHAQNQGLGATIRDGLQAAAERCAPDDVIITMDADNSHPPRLIPELLAALGPQVDIAIASRYRVGAETHGVPGHRLLLSNGARWLFQLLLPIAGVRDYTCGYRAYRAAMVQRAFAVYGDRFVSESGFQCMADILIKLRPLGVRCREIPLILRYDLKGGVSKMKVLRTVWRTLSLLLRRRLFGCRP